MFQKSIEAIIAQGVKGLEGLKKEINGCVVEAQEQVQRSQSEIQSLVNLAKQVPEKVFDRYSHVLISTTLQTGGQSAPFYGEIRIAESGGQLRGLMGNESIKAGKYRVIVLLEPLS